MNKSSVKSYNSKISTRSRPYLSYDFLPIPLLIFKSISYIRDNFCWWRPEGYHILPRRTNISPLWCVNMIYCPLKYSHIYIHVMNLNLLYIILVLKGRSRESSVSIEAHYGLDSPGIEFRWGRVFHETVQNGPGTHPPSYTMGTVSLPRVKQPGRDVDHPTPSRAEVKERVELYFYLPSGTSWFVLAWTFCWKALLMTWNIQRQSR